MAQVNKIYYIGDADEPDGFSQLIAVCDSREETARAAREFLDKQWAASESYPDEREDYDATLKAAYEGVNDWEKYTGDHLVYVRVDYGHMLMVASQALIAIDKCDKAGVTPYDRG